MKRGTVQTIVILILVLLLIGFLYYVLTINLGKLTKWKTKEEM